MTVEPLVFKVTEGSFTNTSPAEKKLKKGSLSFQNGISPPMIVTPTSSDGALTPQSCNQRKDRNNSFQDSAKRNEKEPCCDAIETLDKLLEGILAVKRVLERPLDDPLSDPGTKHSSRSEDSKRITDLSNQLAGVLGSHLIGLWNAANMVQDYAKLHNEENAILLQELRDTQKLCIESNARTEQADKANRRLCHENQLLVGRVQKLRVERRALVKECKSLRTAAEETRKFDASRWLEEHMLDSLAIHEMILKKCTYKDTDGQSHCEEKEEQGDDVGHHVSVSKEALVSDVALGRDTPATANCDLPRRDEMEEGSNCYYTGGFCTNLQKATEEGKGCVPKKRGFFSRFSMTAHEKRNSFAPASISKRYSSDSAEEEETKEEETHKVSEEWQQRINVEESSDKQKLSLPLEKCTKVVDAATPDDLVLRGIESLRVIESHHYKEGYGARRGFGRFWHVNHPEFQNGSHGGNTEDESSRVSVVPGSNDTEVTTHVDNNSKTIPADKVTLNLEESSFVFDGSYRVTTQILNNTNPIQDHSSQSLAIVDDHEENLASNDPIIIPWRQIWHKESTRKKWNGKGRKVKPKTTKALLGCISPAKHPSRTKMRITNNGVPTLSRSMLLVSLLLALITPSLTFQSFQQDSINRKRSFHHEHGRRIPFSGAAKHRSSLTRLFLDDIISPIPANPKKKNLKTFQRYLEIECWKRAEIRELEPVLKSVAESCKQINRIVQRAQTDDLYGVALGADGKPLEETNIQGEVQQQLDVLCNTYMLRAFCGSGSSIHSVASEEEDEPRCCSDVMTDSAFAVGDYIAVFDPIDGSKNIDASLPVGNIFAVYKCQPGSTVDQSTFLQDGRSIVAAGYCLFSATTVLVLTLGSGVDGFTLDPDSGRFLHTLKDIRIPRKGPIYSFNEANYRGFDAPVKRFLNMLKEGGSSTGLKMTARYIGALVADVHNILINGGIYGYPSTRSNPNGKLRLLYECAPMAMILEQAGGAASTGKGRILDVKPREIHQRTPVFLGSVENVFELDQFFQYYDDEDDDEQDNRNEER